MGAWDNLSIREKADMMKAAIRNGITTLPEIKQAYNEFAEGGNIYGGGGQKKSGGSFYQTHRARWFNFLCKKGVNPVKAERLASYFSAQDALESGHGTSSAARQKNNYGGMQRLDKKTNKMVNVSYGSIDDYMNAKWKMMNSKYSRALNAKSIQEYANILNDPKYHGKGYMYGLYEGYRDGQPLDVARQTKYMNNYTKIMMDIAGEKGFKGADVPDDLSIMQSENPYTQFIPFEPFNPQVFNSPQAFVAPTREQFEVEQPIVEAAKDYAYSPEQLEKEERRQGLNNLSFILGMMNGGNGSSFADTIGMLTGNIAANGGKIHIKPENRGKFTALKERTGHSATWFKEHGTPAQKKMATFALNARHWKHGLGGNLYEEGGPEKKWKALDNIDFVAIPDTSFTRDKTGVGSIEYFDSRYPEGITYPNGYHREHPLPGKDVILYNPNDNDKQDIRLDALHIMPKDATYDTLYSQYLDEIYTGQAGDLAWKGVKKWEDDAKKYGKNNIDTKNQYIRNEADGLLRNSLIEGDSDYRKQKGYSASKSDAVKEFPTLAPYVDAIQNYLVTGERPANILPEVTITGKKKNKKAFGGHIYDGTTEDSQQMNTPRYRKLLDAEIKEELSDNDVMELPLAAELSDVRVTGKKKRNVLSQIKEKWVKNDKGEEVPTYWGYNPDTKQLEQLYRLEDGKSADESVFFTPDGGWSYNVPQAAEMRKAHEQWVKNGGNASDFDKVALGYLGFGLTPIALPEAAAGIWAASQTPVGQTLLAGTLGGEAWEALNHGITGQSWGDNLGDVIGFDKDNYLGRTALGLTNPFYGLSPSMIYRGGEAVLGAGKTALNLAENTASKSVEALQNKYPALFDPYTSWDATLGYHGDNIFNRAVGTIGRKHGYTPRAEVPEFHRRLDINRPEEFRLTDDGKFVISSGRTGDGHDGIVNFATSEPARGHGNHRRLSGTDDYIINPKVIGNQDFKSIQPSDTFFETGELTINPKDVTIVSGNTSVLDHARSMGMKTLSSPKLRQLTAKRVTKEEIVNDRAKDGLLKFIQRARDIKYGKGKENLENIGREIQRLTSMRGAPTIKDYAYFENMTGLNSGVRPAEIWNGTKEQGLELFGDWGTPLNDPSFNHVAYTPASSIESIYRGAKMGERPWSDYYEALEKMPSARQQLGQ